MIMERAFETKSCSFIRIVFVIFQALTGSDFSDSIVTIVLVSPELLRLDITGKIRVTNC